MFDDWTEWMNKKKGNVIEVTSASMNYIYKLLAPKMSIYVLKWDKRERGQIYLDILRWKGDTLKECISNYFFSKI